MLCHQFVGELLGVLRTLRGEGEASLFHFSGGAYDCPDCVSFPSPCRSFRDVPNADRDVVARSGSFTLGLADMHDSALDCREPLVDVFFVAWFNHRLAMAAHEREHFDSFLHDV
jgi:hypothetical protein